jgi:predicted ABC-type ATPase
MPEYTVVAGPNGVGKSTFSKIFSAEDSIIFDPDKVKAVKERQYPDIPLESIETMITTEYWNTEDSSVEKNLDLTVETNLRNGFLIDRLQLFKSRGYTTNLIYMILQDIKLSTDRVGLRTAQKGHYIDPESIKYNFNQGLEVLKQHFKKFDNFLLMDGSVDKQLALPKRLLQISNQQISYFNAETPSWTMPLIDEIILKLNSN